MLLRLQELRVPSIFRLCAGQQIGRLRCGSQACACQQGEPCQAAGAHLSRLKARSILGPTPAVFSSVSWKAALAASLSPAGQHVTKWPHLQRARSPPRARRGA